MQSASRRYIDKGNSIFRFDFEKVKILMSSSSRPIDLAANWNGRAESWQLLEPAERACDFSTVTFIIHTSHFRKWINVSDVRRRLRIANAILFTQGEITLRNFFVHNFWYALRQRNFYRQLAGGLSLDIINDIMLAEVIKSHVRNSNANIAAFYMT